MKSFLLRLLLLVFPISAMAQSQLHTYKLFLDHPAKTISGEFALNFRNESGAPLSEIYLHLPSRSLEWKYSLLHQQFIDFQNVKPYFAKTERSGKITTTIPFSPSDYVAPHSISGDEEGEFIKIVLRDTLQAADSILLQLHFEMLIPEYGFNGSGYDGEMYRLINWLPRLAMRDSLGWQLNPVSYQDDIYQHFHNYSIMLDLPAEFRAIGNGVTDTLALLGERYKVQLNFRQSLHPLIFISPSIYRYALDDKSFLYLTQPEALVVESLRGVKEIVDEFFREELGSDIPEQYDILLLEDKKGEYQSEKLLILPVPGDLFELSSELAHARAQQLFRYSIALNGFKEVWLARGLPWFYKFRFVKYAYPEKKWLPFSNSFIGKFFDLDEFDYAYQNQFLYLYLARQGLDQPMSTPADSLNRLNYEAVAQGKSFLALSHLAEYMGERDFRRGMRRFFQRHQGRTGTAADLQQNLAYYHFRDLHWFFQSLVHSASYTDYQLEAFDFCPTVSTARIDNEKSLPIPFSVTGYKDGREIHTDWFSGHPDEKSLQLYHHAYDRLLINKHQNVPEFSLQNNMLRTSGLFKRMEPLRFQLWNGFEDPQKTQIFWMPSASYNAYDQLLAGISFYNKSLVNKPMEYVLGPEYSTGTGRITGYGSLLFNLTPRATPFHRISFGLFTRYRHYDEGLSYFRASPAVNLYFRRSHPKSDILQKIRLRSVSLQRELPGGFEGVPNELSNASYSIFNLNYELEDINVLRPLTLDADFQYGDKFSKLTFTADLRWMLPNKRWLIWRQFGGVFMHNDFRQRGLENNYYSFGLSGTRDYLFDYELIGRSDESGIWSRQFFVSDGGFKSMTRQFADRYMLTSTVSLPIWTVFGVFGGLGISDENPLHWEYGGRLAIFTDFLEFYFPFRNHRYNFLAHEAYYQNIRFVLNIDPGEIIGRLRRAYY